METFLNILSYIILGLSILIAIGWCLNVRHKAKSQQATEKSQELSGFLLTMSVMLVPLLSMSSFHLLWMIPVSFIVGLLSINSPLRLLWIFSSFYFFFWYIGIQDTGRKYYMSGDFHKAIDAYKESLNKKPNSAETHFNLGLAYGKIGEHENEIESYLEAIRLKPNEQVYFNLGTAYIEIGNKQKAIEAFNEAIRLENNYAKAHYMICKTYAEIGDRESAIKEYELLKKMNMSLDEELETAIKNI